MQNKGKGASSRITAVYHGGRRDFNVKCLDGKEADQFGRTAIRDGETKGDEIVVLVKHVQLFVAIVRDGFAAHLRKVDEIGIGVAENVIEEAGGFWIGRKHFNASCLSAAHEHLQILGKGEVIRDPARVVQLVLLPPHSFHLDKQGDRLQFHLVSAMEANHKTRHRVQERERRGNHDTNSRVGNSNHLPIVVNGKALIVWDVDLDRLFVFLKDREETFSIL